jgi:mRNA interferase HicA
MCEDMNFKGSEFLRKVQRLAKSDGVVCHFSGDRGKGSHGTLYYGSGLTTLKDRKKEIGPGLLRSMCNDLGIDPRDL